ncbi:Mur ligase family protein [Aquariibacter albus]|uniref:UDP-N-acetylmuramoyl-L-alanyl-D-glutamate--2,6-diaminopimelate ligase n=1 Tax=Aquariibacter albus TaxID=2759899 RepID=A0A839HLS0_9BURK|nr:UDP-N-acetylmuramoyl-L-alanyl-D-glutamate--2,6-diaminopimelate ligase [Aquariibacter albus]MBB1162262.1 UDP-N-acetylmuramoyl-L-alanyl-D-glutamate--2,6-diaminopimelate ligase [Aquariibacter albus]
MPAPQTLGPLDGVVQLGSVGEALAWLRASGSKGLSSDSRRLAAGEAFIAWPGLARDPRAHVHDAFLHGAQVALVEAEGLAAWSADWPLPIRQRTAAVAGLKAAAGPLAAAFFGLPGMALDVVAVTGTNGKTSSSWWIAQLLSALERPAGVIGTLGLGPVGGGAAMLVPTGFTTPDPVQLQRALRGMVDGGLKAVAIEASSIGLVESRLDGLPIRVAIYTNFSQDHLDFHGSMAAYAAAKRRLFDWPGLQAAVLNVDDAEVAAQAAGLAVREARGEGPACWTTSARGQAGARLRAVDHQLGPDGLAFTVVEHGPAGETRLPLATRLLGDFHVDNLLGVIGALRALGHPLPAVVAACAALGPVPGRMQRVQLGRAPQPAVLVDYAHTPDALAQALATLRPLATARGGRLAVLFGCGGDRDRSKRPRMAAAAEAGADRVWLSSDNPRSEDPQALLAEVAAGLQRPQLAMIEPDRRAAIAAAVAACTAADVLLIAGKGHETTQEIAGVKHPLSDVAEAETALQAWLNGARA